MNLRMRSEEKAEKAHEDAAEAARQVAEAWQRAGEAEARVRRLEDELRRVQTQGQNDVSRTQFLETESARLRQEVEALRGQAAEDGKEKKRLDEGWTRESAHRRRAQSERDAARDKEREGRAGWAAAEHARAQAVEERDAALAELQEFKANYNQFVDWVRMLCRLAGLAAEDTDGLGEWVQAARKRQLQRQQQEQGEASSAVSVKTEGGSSSKSGKARAYEEEEEEEDEVGLNALTMKYREAQRELNGAKDLLVRVIVFAYLLAFLRFCVFACVRAGWSANQSINVCGLTTPPPPLPLCLSRRTDRAVGARPGRGARALVWAGENDGSSKRSRAGIAVVGCFI